MSVLRWRRQFARPTGILGSVVGRLMAMKNRERSRWVLPLLDARPGERVLEVGFGSGADVARVAASVADGLVAGIDHSEVMVRQARRRNRAAIAAGHVSLEQGAAGRLPYAAGAFDKAYAINVAQFWDSAGEPLGELRRVLRPGGLLAIAVQPRAKDASERTARDTGAFLVKALGAAGFTDVRLETKALRPVSTVCVLGRKAAST